MGIFRSKRKPTIFVIVKGGAFFFFLMCLATMALFAIGSFKRYTDETLHMLLRLAGFFGLLLGINGAFGILMEFWFLFRKDSYRIYSNITLYAILGLFGALVATIAIFINAVTGGYA